jgi:hypothetical protein
MLAPIRPSPIMPSFTDGSSSQQEASESPATSNEKDYPNEVASPSPRLVAKVGRLAHRSCPEPATSLDIARVWRSPSAIAPTIGNRRYEKQEHEYHPQDPP